MHKRRQLYKSPLVNSPPPWKDVYRKKCFERLRERRASLIEKFRFSESPSKMMMMMEASSPSKIVSDVMEIEWNAIHKSRSFPSLSMSSSGFESEGVTDWEENLMRETLKEIQDELHNEDEARLNEFLQFDSRELEAKVDMMLSEEVICPICKKGLLRENICNGGVTPSTHTVFQTPPRTVSNMMTVVRCECCGVVLSSGKGVGCTLSKVRSALQQTLCEHEKHCPSPIIFTPTSEENGRTTILVTCSSCEWVSFLF